MGYYTPNQKSYLPNDLNDVDGFAPGLRDPCFLEEDMMSLNRIRLYICVM